MRRLCDTDFNYDESRRRCIGSIVLPGKFINTNEMRVYECLETGEWFFGDHPVKEPLQDSSWMFRMYEDAFTDKILGLK